MQGIYSVSNKLVQSNGMKPNSWNSCPETFVLLENVQHFFNQYNPCVTYYTRKYIFTVEVTRHWHKFTGGISILSDIETRLDMVLGHQLQITQQWGAAHDDQQVSLPISNIP